MAEIFLARQPGLEGFEKLVVVKRLLPQFGAEPDFVRMFLNEARLAARLSHPNIVQIFELGHEEGAYYLSMEYILGEDVRALAQQADATGNRPPLGLICRIVIDALAGLHYAHTRTGPDGKPLGLVHRDITPQNILVTFEGTVKIIDFGIAKATQQRQAEQTQAGLLKGKYAYMSPEQTRGGQLDARSDVFAAGILLWELLTWRRLFKRGTDLATLVAISEEPAPPMSLINPEVPEELDQIALTALSVNPDDRFPSAQAFQAALEECVAVKGWAGDNRALGHYMRELFKDKLAAQREEATAAGARSVEEHMLNGGASGPMRAQPRQSLQLRTVPAGAQADPVQRQGRQAEDPGLKASPQSLGGPVAGPKASRPQSLPPQAAGQGGQQGMSGLQRMPRQEPSGPQAIPGPQGQGQQGMSGPQGQGQQGMSGPQRMPRQEPSGPQAIPGPQGQGQGQQGMSGQQPGSSGAHPVSGWQSALPNGMSPGMIYQPQPGEAMPQMMMSQPQQEGTPPRRRVLIAVVAGLVLGLVVVLLLTFFGADGAGKGVGLRGWSTPTRVATASAESASKSPISRKKSGQNGERGAVTSSVVHERGPSA